MQFIVLSDKENFLNWSSFKFFKYTKLIFFLNSCMFFFIILLFIKIRLILNNKYKKKNLKDTYFKSEYIFFVAKRLPRFGYLFS